MNIVVMAQQQDMKAAFFSLDTAAVKGLQEALLEVFLRSRRYAPGLLTFPLLDVKN
jgi:hypothetical protein